MLRLGHGIVCQVIRVDLTVARPNILRLIAITKPVVKVVAELFEDVHVVAYLACAVVLLV